MRAVRFTKAEAEYLRAGLGQGGWNTALFRGGQKVAASILAKLDQATLPRKTPETGLGVPAAIRVMEDVLGKGNLAVPPNPSGSWYGRVGARVKQIGLTEDDCRAIAAHVSGRWQMPVAFESLVWGAPKLLAEARRVGKVRQAPLAPEDL